MGCRVICNNFGIILYGCIIGYIGVVKFCNG